MKAYYLHFKRGRGGGRSFIGGQPTHLPTSKPWPVKEDGFYGFFMQIWNDGVLPSSDILCLQFYQPINLGADPTPIVIAITSLASPNEKLEVLTVDHYEEHGIEFEITEEPEKMPALESDSFINLMHSKFGGHDPWLSGPPVAKRYLGQITEHPADLEFGGTATVLYLGEGNEIIVEQH